MRLVEKSGPLVTVARTMFGELAFNLIILKVRESSEGNSQLKDSELAQKHNS